MHTSLSQVLDYILNLVLDSECQFVYIELLLLYFICITLFMTLKMAQVFQPNVSKAVRQSRFLLDFWVVYDNAFA